MNITPSMCIAGAKVVKEFTDLEYTGTLAELLANKVFIAMWKARNLELREKKNNQVTVA